jgi:hypothetical protein
MEVGHPPVLVVEVWLAARDLRGLNPDPELSDVENVWIHSIGAWLAVLFSLPVVWFNVRLAFWDLRTAFLSDAR